MKNIDWNEKAKRLLKAELVKRGVSTEGLVILLQKIGVNETRSSIDSKISRGSFSAVFLIQCLNAIGCRSFLPDVDINIMAPEPVTIYKTARTKNKSKKHARN